MGELGETIRKICDMERDLYGSQKKEAMDPIMMDEEQTKEIMERERVTCSGRPY
jgi:hypothetical protein